MFSLYDFQISGTESTYFIDLAVDLFLDVDEKLMPYSTTEVPSAPMEGLPSNPSNSFLIAASELDINSFL